MGNNIKGQISLFDVMEETEKKIANDKIRKGNIMVIYLPCKLGERFIEQKFLSWDERKKRVYTDGTSRTLKGFDAFDCQIYSLSIPTIITKDGNLLKFDPTGEFSQQFIPRYKISVDVKTQYKLSDRGFPSGRTAHLFGLLIEDDGLYADFVTNDRHEHLRFPIQNSLLYAKLDEVPMESVIEYDTSRKEIDSE